LFTILEAGILRGKMGMLWGGIYMGRVSKAVTIYDGEKKKPLLGIVGFIRVIYVVAKAMSEKV
jgi:hypothetical protein